MSEGTSFEENGRLSQLPKHRCDMYTVVLENTQLHRENPESRFFSEQEGALEDFLLTFLETDTFDSETSNLASYAANEQSFLSKGFASRFRIEAVVGSGRHGYDPEKEYGSRATLACNFPHKAAGVVYLDAPFSYLLTFKRPDGTQEIISTTSFTPDFRDGMVYIDQLQGGSTAAMHSTRKSRRMRLKFDRPQEHIKNVCEEILFDLVVVLAEKAGFNGVALRKPHDNRWEEVKGRARRNERTLYETISARKLLYSEGGTYFYKSIS